MNNLERLEKSFGFVIVNKNNKEPIYLIIQNVGNEDWGFPKGLSLENEKPLDTAKRELKEEVDIVDVEILPNLKFTDNYDCVINKTKVNKTIVFFVGIVKDTKISIQESEVKDYLWGNYNQALGRLTFQSQKNILIKINNYILNKNHE